MAEKNPTYDLMLLLDPEAADDQRTKVLADVERIISSAGEIVGDQDWGLRTMAYEVRHKPDAQYRLVQFHAGADTLRELDRTLHIADGLIRYRIIKLKPGTPPLPTAEAVEPAATA
jgi:small subunit ribosomal protein S6